MSGYTTVERLLAYMELEQPDAATMNELGGLIDRVSTAIDASLGFTFEFETAITELLDGPAGPKLYLSAPGAARILSVSETGATIDAAGYALEPRLGRFLLRLSASGGIAAWGSAPRSIAVTYLPNVAPSSIEEVCIEECVRRWQGRAAGYPDVVGVAGSNERRYTKAWAPSSLPTLDAVRVRYQIKVAS